MAGFGQIVDPGVKRRVSELMKNHSLSFDASFSRTLKTMVSNKLIETSNETESRRNQQTYGIALSETGQQALRLISGEGKLNNNNNET